MMRKYPFFCINLSTFILGVVLFFNLGINDAFAAPIKILSNSRHAYSTIISTINQLLGRSYTDSEFIIHSTAMNDTYAGASANVALSTTTPRYDASGASVASQGPYHLYTSSFTGFPGDTVNEYNLSATNDVTHNYASTYSVNKPPPAFHIAPGGDGWASVRGVEWTIDPVVFCSSSLSCMTAANAGILGWLRLNHPTWNWFDVKAAMRQTGTNWATGYSIATYGFGVVNATTTNALTDNQILLQPPAVATTTSGVYSQITFTVYPFKQTRRAKEVLFQFTSNPGFQANELTLAQIQTLGGTKIMEYTGTTATTTAPISNAVTNAYFVWFTADNVADSSASFSRIDTYAILGPLSQSDVPFSATFDLSTPANNGIASSTSPTFTWNAASSYLGISKYQLFVDGVLNKDNIAGTSATSTGSLSDGAHTWYVKAFNGGETATSSVSTRTVNIISDYSSGYLFYVDNVLGNNNNPGTQALPWATLTKAGNTAQAGDTVMIVKNVGQPYRETLTPANSGSSGFPITFRGVDVNNKPEIWGSTDISGSGWSSYGGGNPNTYQRAVTAYPLIVATGPSIGNLSKRTQQVSNNPAVLAPGEWAWSGNLYYRLNTDEDITTLHIEVAQRNNAIVGSAYNTFRDLVVRYVNGEGISIPSRSIGERIEVYDSETGAYLYGSGTSVDNPGPTLRYSVFAGNTTGIYLSLPYYARVYNNISYGNDTGIYVQTWAMNSIFRNNTFDGNTNYDVNWNSFGVQTSGFIASHNNWSGTVNSTWENSYQGTNNRATLSPLLTDGANKIFRLQEFSGNIDAGTAISGLTTDILGNPIYGTPDIGPYEYQPPYVISTDKVPLTGTLRLYKDGKYRMTSATTSTATANMTISPEGGFPSGEYSEYLNVTINSWNTSGDYTKSWTESSLSAGATAHTVGDLAPNGFYAVNVDGTRYAQFRADAGGQGTFTYSGGYSTHTFSIAPDLSIGNGPIVGSSFGLPTPLPDESTTTAQPSISSSSSSQTTSTVPEQRSDLKAPQGQTLTEITTATSTASVASSTSPAAIKEKIVELQSKLIILLKQFVVLLTEQLQNIKKTI